jgi:hypothetical protein
MGRWRSLPAESETTSATIASSRFFPGAVLYSYCTGTTTVEWSSTRAPSK